jgi:L-asparaginase II
MEKINPALIELTRGSHVESRHRGAAVVVDGAGTVIASWGDVDHPVFPRSAAKPLQALPLVESGAADHFAVSDAEVALACASHGGGSEHVRQVAGWLHRIGCNENDLVCGPHAPLAEPAARALIRSGQPPSRLHNNCSGKHAGFLTLCRHLGCATAGYGTADHPVQRHMQAVLAETGGFDIDHRLIAIDGCNVPVIAMPLAALARAFAKLADPSRLAAERARAMRRIAAAMLKHPVLVGDDDRFDTKVMAAAGGTVVVKGGAEGVMAAALPTCGLGMAVKIDDGAKRAVEAAMAALLLRFAPLGGRGAATVEAFCQTPVTNTAGICCGTMGPVPGWPG